MLWISISAALLWYATAMYYWKQQRLMRAMQDAELRSQQTQQQMEAQPGSGHPSGPADQGYEVR